MTEFERSTGRRLGRPDEEARSLGATHAVRIAKVQTWLAPSAKSPSDKIMKERLKGLLASWQRCAFKLALIMSPPE